MDRNSDFVCNMNYDEYFSGYFVSNFSQYNIGYCLSNIYSRVARHVSSLCFSNTNDNTVLVADRSGALYRFDITSHPPSRTQAVTDASSGTSIAPAAPPKRARTESSEEETCDGTYLLGHVSMLLDCVSTLLFHFLYFILFIS